MLRLNGDQYSEAIVAMKRGISEAYSRDYKPGDEGLAVAALAALGEDFDVEPMETWPDDDLAQRAIDAALAKSPAPTSWTKIL